MLHSLLRPSPPFTASCITNSFLESLSFCSEFPCNHHTDCGIPLSSRPQESASLSVSPSQKSLCSLSTSPSAPISFLLSEFCKIFFKLVSFFMPQAIVLSKFSLASPGLFPGPPTRPPSASPSSSPILPQHGSLFFLRTTTHTQSWPS